MAVNAFRAFIDRSRVTLNSDFAAALRDHPSLSGDEYLASLRTLVEPAVTAAADAGGDTDSIGSTLSRIVLSLMTRRILNSARGSIVTAAWERIIVPSKLLTQDAHALARLTVNAVLSLASRAESTAAAWIDIIASMLPEITSIEQFESAGRFAAWVLGAAELRDRVLADAKTIPEQITARLLSIPLKGTRSTLEELARNPWHHPSGTKPFSLRHRTGGFRGFNGIFITPPEVFTAEGMLFARDTEHTYRLFADSFGSALIRMRSEAPIDDSDAGYALKKGALVSPRGTVQDEITAGAEGIAAAGGTAVITRTDSHWLFVYG